MHTHGAVFAIPSDTRFRGHEHPGLHLCAVVSGGFVEKSGRGWVDVGPGTVRISSAARHDIDFSPAGAQCLVMLPGLPLSGLDAPRFLSPDPWMSRLVGALANRMEAASPLEIDEAADEFLAQIQRRLEGRSAAPPPWLQQLRERIDDGEATSVGELAIEYGVHRVHLARAFRDHYGTSLSRHLQRARLVRARRLLAATDLTLADVAATAGFADQSHLTRSVRSALGTTPAALRRTLHPFKTAPAPAR
jgi:AraC family transcriptional regulator